MHKDPVVHVIVNEKLLVGWQFSGPYDVTKYSSGWRKDVVNQCLEFGSYHVQADDMGLHVLGCGVDILLGTNCKKLQGSTKWQVKLKEIAGKTHRPFCMSSVCVYLQFLVEYILALWLEIAHHNANLTRIFNK